MARTFTSASANKFLRTLDDEKYHLLEQERETCVYTRAAGEADEPPAYSYDDVRAKVAAIDAQARAIRHALHLFNATTTLPESGITIDEALIKLAQLSALKDTLSQMRDRREKERVVSNFTRSEMIEYRYANYDIAQASADYSAVLEQIANLQLEIDLANQTRTFEVEL